MLAASIPPDDPFVVKKFREVEVEDDPVDCDAAELHQRISISAGVTVV